MSIDGKSVGSTVIYEQDSKQNHKNMVSLFCINKGIREHWGIENKMQWVKDVIQNEDKSMVRDYIRSENMSVVRNIVINLFRVNGYKSTKYAIEKFSDRLNSCIGLIYSNLYIY